MSRLDEEREFLRRSLEDLEHEHAAGDLDERDYLTLRADYAARAAAALRQGEEEPAEEPVAGPGRRRRRWVGVVVVAALAAGAGVVVARASGVRLPGQTGSGDIATSINRSLAEARLLLGRGEAVEAIQRYDEVLASDPDNAEALTYRGWLLVLAGLDDEGMAYLERGIAADPDYADPHFFRGYALRQAGDLEGALSEYETFLGLDPPPDLRPDAVRQAAEEIRAELAGD